MTNELRERVLRAIEQSNGEMTIEGCRQMIAHQERLISYWTENSFAWEAKHKLSDAEARIEYFNVVIEVLTEFAEVEVANEATKFIAAFPHFVQVVMQKIVCRVKSFIRIKSDESIALLCCSNPFPDIFLRHTSLLSETSA